MRLSSLAKYLAAGRAQIARHLPVPLAAPESPALGTARRRIIAALLALASIGLGAKGLSAFCPLLAAACFALLLTFLALQIPLWLRAKLRADHAWLMRESEKDDRDD